ncbi:hypothetical protein BH23ACT9_BH23ACT9_30080 [soil metagenome]
MRDLTADSDHASDEVGSVPDDAIDLITATAPAPSAPGTTDADADSAPAAPTDSPVDWMPRLTVAPEDGRRGWGLWAMVLGGITLMLVTGAITATRLPGGTTLVGLQIDSADDAPRALALAEAGLAELEFEFTTEAGSTTTATGADLGLSIDEVASTQPVTNGLNAVGLWLRRLPQGPQDSPFVADPVAPETLAAVAEDVSTDPVNADVQVTLAGVDVTPGEDGLTAAADDVDVALRAALATIATQPPTSWPAALEVDVSGQAEPPPVTQVDIDQVTAAIDVAEQATVTVRVADTDPAAEGASDDAESEEGTAADDEDGEDDGADGSITLTPTELRSLVRVQAAPDAPSGERLQLVPDTEATPGRIERLMDVARVLPVMTGSIENRSDTPRQGDDLTDVSTITGDVIAGQTIDAGFEPDPSATLADVIEAALGGGGDVVVSGAPYATPSPADMGIVEPVSTFTTFFPAGQSRVQNIVRIAEIVDGTIILPGQSYELNHAVGRRTRENGFTLGGAILDGQLVSDIGGGVSQFATTFFNAAWFAGVDLIDWKAHSFYFPRYPAGREATINFPNVNLEIRNDTPHAILIDTETTPTSVTVSFWSTPHWDVETRTGPCACGGAFSITVERIRTEPAGQPIEESWTTFYTVERSSN